jgi:hypothetical protein
MHDDLLAEQLACLILEVAAEIGPVDKQGGEQRYKERNHEQAAKRYQYASEHRMPLP